jgi:ABC-type dipeptide/oligopeptide/nickel transport system permease component
MGGLQLLRYVLRRLLQVIPVVLGVVVLNFLLLQLAPGDAATVLAGEAGGAPPEYVQQLRERFGLDKPLLVQLALYMKNILGLHTISFDCQSSLERWPRKAEKRTNPPRMQNRTSPAGEIG